jgi:hypothetical protein
MTNVPPARKIFARLSIAAGNAIQIGGLLGAVVALNTAASSSNLIAVALVLLSFVLVYFCCHGIAHWAVGRLLGIHFAYYTIGGTANPEGWPAGLRWIFEHLPFFGVQTEKASMQTASPTAKAIMWSAGVTSSAVLPTLTMFCAWREGVALGEWLFLGSVFWSIGTLSSNWRSCTGDYAKARRALGKA